MIDRELVTNGSCNDFCITITWNKYVSNYFDGNVLLFIEMNFLRLVCLEIYRLCV